MQPLKKIKGRYEIKAVLGEGGMGVVYRAYDPPPMNRDVALKTLLEFPDQMSLQMFYKECEVLKSLSHPNIVEIFDIGEFEDGGRKKPFFVMPLLRGQTLDELIKNASHRLTVERVVEIIAQTCRGLQAAHDRNLVHRDLKPSNLWVMEDDSVKIIDFGVAYAMDARTRSSGFQKGTLLYMAPEQILFKPISPQCDIFALGVVCYEALTRRQPFRGTSEETVVNSILKHIPPPASEVNPSINQAISRVVHKAIAKQPWNRFETAREFGETLQKALRNQPIELFDPARIRPRIIRATKALENGDYQFADEIVGELEAEGNLDPELTLLRTQIDQVVRQKTIAQLLESARARFEEDEDPLALQKIQDVLQLDPNNVAALQLKSKIENRRNERQVEKWLRLAHQHVDSHSYSHAREALKNVLQLRPNEPRALRLLNDVETEEREYLKLRQRKVQVYQSALNAYRNGEVSQALADMGMVLELDRQAPDTSSPETSSQYQNFYNQVRSEHDAINAGYAEASRALAEGEFAKAVKLCQDFLTKYPNLALFQALKFDVDEQQRQQLSSFIADVNRRLEAELDLDAKVNLLREAVAAYPDEPHFQRSLRLMTDKRDLVNGILARSRAHEQQGQINEALNDLETLRTIYRPYPGLQFEIERLQKRREQQAREEAKNHWIEQIDRQMQTGNYGRGLELLQRAAADFPNDTELTELEKLARQNLERSKEAEQLLAQGQELCAQGNLAEGVEIIGRARELDRLNPSIGAVLRDALVEQARGMLDKNWRLAEELAKRALELDPSHALAKSIRAQALDHKRDEAVVEHVSKARRLQTAGDLQGAAAEVEKGLKDYPADAKLTAVRNTLSKELDQIKKEKNTRFVDLQEARELFQQAGSATDTDKLTSILERTQSYVAKYPEEAELQTIAREVQRIVKARGEAKLTPKPKPKPVQKAKPPGPSLIDTLRPLMKGRPFQFALGGVGVLVVALLVWRLWPAGSQHPPSVTKFPIEIRTTPPGAAIRINGEQRGTSNLQLELPAGDYQVEASLPGYNLAKSALLVGQGKPSAIDLTLPASPELVRVTTNLDKGDVWLDDKQSGSLENGSFDLPNVSPGQHTLRISTGQKGQEATISFQSAPDAIAASPSMKTQQLQVVVVSTARGAVQVVSSLGEVPVTVDDKANFQLAADGLQIPGLGPGTHDIALGTGKDVRKMSFEVGSAPSLDAHFFSDRDVGSLVIQVAEDDVEVFLNDKPYPRKSQKGHLTIPNLPIKQYSVRVHKDGFKDQAELRVDIQKGQESRLPVVLVHDDPKMAALRLEHLPPGTQVSLDGKVTGTASSDGSLTQESIPPGPHMLTFTASGFKSENIPSTFTAGVTLHPEIKLMPLIGYLDVKAGSNTLVKILQGNREAASFKGSRNVPLDEGDYIVHSSDNSNARPIKVTAGVTLTLDLRITTGGMDHFENFDTWTQQEGWYTHHGGGYLLYESPSEVGRYIFTLQLKHGRVPFFGGHRHKWVFGFKDDKNYTLMEVDGKFLYRSVVSNGAKQPVSKFALKIPGDAQYVTIQVLVTPNSLTHSDSSNNKDYQLLDTYDLTTMPSLQSKPKSFGEGKFGFYVPGDETIQVSNFTFDPRQ